MTDRDQADNEPPLGSLLDLHEFVRLLNGSFWEDGSFDPGDGWPEALTVSELAKVQFPGNDAKQDDLRRAIEPLLGSRIAVTRRARTWRRPGIGPDMPELVAMVHDCMDRAAVAYLLRELGVTPSAHVRAWLASGGVDTGASSDADPDRDLPKKPKVEIHARLIVETLEQMGHDPRALPPQPKGRAGIKRDCRNELIGPIEHDDAAMNFGQFARAWKWAQARPPGWIAERDKP